MEVGEGSVGDMIGGEMMGGKATREEESGVRK